MARKSKELTKKRLILLRLVTVMMSFGISIFFVELVLRIQSAYLATQAKANQESYQEQAYEFSATRHHRLIPNARYRHTELEYDYVWANNSLGMRDRDRSLKKDPQHFRILFVGDSMIQGYGVPLEQSMVYRLEDSLNQPQRQKTIEVLNAGIFGYSPLLELLYLQEILPSVQPDMVMVGFFLGNDVGDDYFYTNQARISSTNGTLYFKDERWPWDYRNEAMKTLEENGSAEQRSQPNQIGSTLGGHVRSLLLKSHIISTLQKAYHRRAQEQEYRALNAQIEQFTQERKDDIRINLGLINYPVLTHQQRMEYWQISLNNLKKIHDLCKAKKIPMVLVVIPAELSFEKDGFTEPYDVLNSFANNLSIPIIQLLPEMRMAPVDNLNFELDGHWNAEGNRLAAEIIDRQIRALKLLPPERN